MIELKITDEHGREITLRLDGKAAFITARDENGELLRGVWPERISGPIAKEYP